MLNLILPPLTHQSIVFKTKHLLNIYSLTKTLHIFWLVSICTSFFLLLWISNISSIEGQKGLTTSHLHTYVDCFASKLMIFKTLHVNLKRKWSSYLHFLLLVCLSINVIKILCVNLKIKRPSYHSCTFFYLFGYQ